MEQEQPKRIDVTVDKKLVAFGTQIKLVIAKAAIAPTEFARRIGATLGL